jgi:hypothetical protein
VDDSLETLSVPEVVETFVPSFMEARVAHALAPWIAVERPTITRTHEPLAAGTFRRLIELEPAHLERLPSWFAAHARDDCVQVTRACALFAPIASTHNAWTIPATLRSVAMELELWRHLPGCTMLMFQPIRKAHAKPLYFRAGHQALDEITRRLQHELA